MNIYERSWFELRRKIWIYEWSSQLHTQLKQAWTGFEPMTSAILVQCSTDWAIAILEMLTLWVRNTFSFFSYILIVGSLSGMLKAEWNVLPFMLNTGLPVGPVFTTVTISGFSPAMVLGFNTLRTALLPARAAPHHLHFINRHALYQVQSNQIIHFFLTVQSCLLICSAFEQHYQSCHIKHYS